MCLEVTCRFFEMTVLGLIQSCSAIRDFRMKEGKGSIHHTLFDFPRETHS